MVTTSAVRYLK